MYKTEIALLTYSNLAVHHGKFWDAIDIYKIAKIADIDIACLNMPRSGIVVKDEKYDINLTVRTPVNHGRALRK